jgi:LIVCS family branched-chain amino acid:cation transporter
MKNRWLVLSTGFALFSMFFGSGNLVFPITIGQQCGGHYLLASLGILLTGVVMPFMGVFGIMLYHGDSRSFFLGKTGLFCFSLVALGLLGPFGIVARCLTVAHGALALLFPGLPLLHASAVFCVLIYLFTVNKNRLVSIIGSFLTPFLLLSIGAIVFFALYEAKFPEMQSADILQPFLNGFFQGYQTMDLLAGFFFASVIITHLRAESNEKALISLFAPAALVGAGLLAAVYISLVTLGWLYAPYLAKSAPQELFGQIALLTLGSMAAPCVCIAVVLACMTTAIVLTYLFAEFVRTEVLQERMGSKQTLALSLLIAFAVSTLEFGGIAKFLGPILECIYPVVILLTVVNVMRKIFVKQLVQNDFI